MTPMRVTWRRTLGVAREHYGTAFAVAGALAAIAVLFAFNLDAAEGGRLALAAVWAVSVSPVLPVLAAVLAMDVWSAERQSGRLAALLTAPVLERDLALGKFFGVWTILETTLLGSLVATLVELGLSAPAALSGVHLTGFLPGFLFLSLQGAFWCAFSLVCSAAFRQGAVAALVSAALTCALPRGVWAALMAWAPQGRSAFGEMPLDAQALDFASGVVSIGMIVSYVVLSVAALFVATKTVLALRLVGRGARSLRFSTGVACVLAVVFAVLTVMLSARLDTTVDFSPETGVAAFSPRTRNILAEAGGDVRITVYLPRNDSNFRPAAQFLRALKREADSVGGVRVELRYVDPRWDLGASERIVRAGVREYSLVFERGRRMVALPVAEGYGERLCASTIQRLTAHPQRRNVYWTTGHGESAFDAYGPFGMSDIARDLSREGYRNDHLDLAANDPVPSDCALVVVAGARTDFSRAELDRLDAYLRQGGRLFAFVSDSGPGGMTTLLTAWGIRPTPVVAGGSKTISGTDVIVSDFSGHSVADPLKGSRIVLERPVGFLPSAAVSGGGGADSIGFSPLARAGEVAVAAAVERGTGAGSDLALRPTRIVAVGDATFALNGSLASRANANRDFFLNCIAYLAGADASNASGTETAVLSTGLDRSGRRLLLLRLAACFPLGVFLVLIAFVFIRRHRR